MISKAHFDRVTGYLQRAAAEGVRAAVGDLVEVDLLPDARGREAELVEPDRLPVRTGEDARVAMLEL